MEVPQIAVDGLQENPVKSIEMEKLKLKLAMTVKR